MPAFYTLREQHYIHEPSVIFALDHALQCVPSHRLDEVLRAVTAFSDIESGNELAMRYYIYNWSDTHTTHPNRQLKDQAQELTWLLRLIWAGLLEVSAKDWGFKALAAAALERLPQDASHEATWTALSRWLAEVQPAATIQCRADFAVWLEEYLTDPRQSFRLTDADPNAALAALQSGQLLPDTPQVRELFGRFIFDWADEQACMWHIPSYQSIKRHLANQLIAQPVAVS